MSHNEPFERSPIAIGGLALQFHVAGREVEAKRSELAKQPAALLKDVKAEAEQVASRRPGRGCGGWRSAERAVVDRSSKTCSRPLFSRLWAPRRRLGFYERRGHFQDWI